ncbi:YetF domain-containing protein [Candidatus Manganitrophus noduliformans]|uniref:DUF421 domain-containing protein n=1 Tax=Candidatus Manganitrophus noduliformans TaxID=2606439 RepID=A0A7X6IBB4_9BACT|nr:DUF421 domain-containing protein [Candidatus Manganitrophus noduliformans]
MQRIFFDNWAGVVRTLIIGIFAYAALVLLLRISGKRTLSKMNAFDLVVTVALGSTLATILLSKNVALVEGILAFVLLIGLQYLVAWASVHSPFVRRIVKSEPALLFYRGEFLGEAMRRERVTEGEVRAAIRAEGFANLSEIEAVVLETDGTFSVVQRAARGEASSLSNVSRPPESLSDRYRRAGNE